MDRRFEFRVLGPLEVSAEGQPLALGGPQQRAVLALLLLSPNQVVSRERMIDALWGESPPATATNALQVAVHGLRKALGRDRVVTQGAGYRLEVGREELDLERFESLTESARGEPPGHAAPKLHAALALCRGVALAGLEGAAFVPAERERLEELRLATLERRIEADLELGQAPELVPELERLSAEHPYRERLHSQLMLALYRSGRQADALDAYRLARTRLVDELGVEPTRQLQDLETAILRQDPALDVGAHATARTRAALPIPAQPLVGRALDVAALTSLVRTPSARLVTLTGPGGTGKTRLALEAAHMLVPDFPGGVVLVDLAPLRDASLVASTLAHAVGVSEEAEAELVERIAASFTGQTFLLVIDNVEHVLDTAATLIADLLAHAPTLRVLATSREPLRIGVEQEYRVPPLGLPPANATAVEEVSRADAVALFVARASAARAGFELTPGNVEAIVDICRALDGLPLALELAAARVRLLSTSDLRDRLEDRLGLLADGARDLPDRQRTLRAAIDWSHDLLDEREQQLLARLALFTGGWTLDAAETVCDADLSTLASLVEKSLVQSTPDADDATRFSMLETLRQYALEQLAASGELNAIGDRHAAYYADLATRLQPILERADAVDEAEREHDNIRRALAHSLEHGDGGTALRLCGIARFWYARGYLTEGSSWIERTLVLGDEASVQRARVLYVGATIAWSGGDHERAIAYGEESLRLARELGDELAEIGALTALGLAHLGIRDLQVSREYHRECLERARAVGGDRWVAIALTNIADLEIMLGNHAEADELAAESLEIHTRRGDIEGEGVALLVLGASSLARGEDADAIPRIVESIRCFQRVDFKDFLVSALVALARACATSDPTRAARLLGAARTLRQPLGPAQFPWEEGWAASTEERVQARIGESLADAEITAGAEDPAAAVAEVLDEAASDPVS
jgi:predicted ATPase/DNA-binding SARP family transcriptional activator